MPLPFDQNEITRRGEFYREGEVFSRYLVGRAASAETLDRFAEGCLRLFGNEAESPDASVTRFACRHPASLPFLDAASGLVAQDSLLRRKLLLMFAILETTPAHANRFLSQRQGKLSLVAGIVAAGFRTAIKAALGLVVLPVARRSG